MIKEKSSMNNTTGIAEKLLFSVGGKILLLVSGTAFLTALFIGTLFYREVERNALTAEKNALAAEARLIAPLFQSSFKELYNDVSVLTKTPPVHGLMRSAKNNSIDPISKLTTEEWSRRLQYIFTSMIGSNDSYVQIRYIGIDDNGRELVRVNRDGQSIEIVPSENLQQKSQEPYFTEAQTTPPGEIYFSAVSANREHGKMQTPFLPVIRTIMPVYDTDGKMFGMIVINAAYEIMLESILEGLTTQKNLYVVNEQGDYIVYEKAAQNSKFYYKSISKNFDTNPIIRTILGAGDTEGSLTRTVYGQELVIHYFKHYFNPGDKTRHITIALSIPRSTFLNPVHEAQRNAIFMTAGLVLLASLCAAFVSGLLIAPLKQMTRETMRYKDDNNIQNLVLPINRRDEIGELARAFHDLTEKLQQSRQAEKQSLGRLQAIVNNTVDGLITINEKGDIETFNKACENIFGYSAEEVIGRNVKILMPDPYRVEHDGYLQNYHNTGEKKIIGIGREVEGQRKDGSTFPLDLSVSEVRIKGLTLYSGIVRDISERKSAENEILRSNEELERFAYIASHDLQEPLRMVANFTSLLEEEYKDQFDAQAGEYMAFIIDAAKRMQDLVGDLLEYSRIGNDGGGFTDVNCTSHTEMAISNLQDAIEETGAVITVEELPVIFAQPIRFTRLMQNLIGNGIKYRAKNKIPEITVKTEDRGDEWLFSIADNGIGMKEEYLEQIFIIFKRLHGKKDYKGTGIGLAVCKKIIESFEGKIWAESVLGKGSTFYFTVPKKEAAKKAA